MYFAIPFSFLLLQNKKKENNLQSLSESCSVEYWPCCSLLFFFVVLDVVADAIINLILLLLFLAFFMNLDEKRKKALRPISSLLDLTLAQL